MLIWAVDGWVPGCSGVVILLSHLTLHQGETRTLEHHHHHGHHEYGQGQLQQRLGQNGIIYDHDLLSQETQKDLKCPRVTKSFNAPLIVKCNVLHSLRSAIVSVSQNIEDRYLNSDSSWWITCLHAFNIEFEYSVSSFYCQHQNPLRLTKTDQKQTEEMEVGQ